MLTFTSFPAAGSVLGQPLAYTVSGDTACTFDLRFTAADGTLLGARRFARQTKAVCDAAPILRRAVHFAPTPAGTGFQDDPGRTVTAAAALYEPGAATDAEPLATAPQRTFLPCSAAVTAPTLLTTMPRQRLLAPGERDELTLYTDGALTVTVTAETATATLAESFHTATAGWHRFVVDTRDFPEAEILAVDAGACGEVGYTLLAAPEGARRLAWRTECGSVEHYTFPVERTMKVATTRQRILSTEGIRSAVTARQRTLTLESAYETPPLLEALAGLLTAPQVWLADEEGYAAADLKSEEAVIDRHGALGRLEIEVCTTQNESPRWN